MNLEIVDTHAHLGYPEFAAELPEIIQRATDAGVTRIITIGVDLPRSEQAIALAERFEGVYAAVGVHPTEAEKAPADITDVLRKFAAHPKVVAIGETGYDFHHAPVNKDRQREIFQQHLTVATECNLAVIIHQRDSFAETVAELKAFEKPASAGKPLRGVFHCFGGSVEEAKAVLDLGFLISFTGILTFKNAESVRAAAKAIPLEKIMVETDCPYLAPHPHRGKRCEPAHTRLTAEKLAEVKGVSLEEVARVTSANAKQLFGVG